MDNSHSLVKLLQNILDSIPIEYCEEIDIQESECARCNLSKLVDELKRMPRDEWYIYFNG